MLILKVTKNKSLHTLSLQTVYFLKYILKVKAWIFLNWNFNIIIFAELAIFHSIQIKMSLKKLIEKSLGKRFDVWYMAFGICRRTSLNLSHSLKVFEYQVSLPEHYCKATSEKSLLHFKWQWHRFTWKSFSYKSRALNKTFYYYYLCWRYVPYYIAKF